MTGFFTGTVDFDPSMISTHYLSSNGGRDVFVVKLDSTGSFVWAANMGGNADDFAKGIAVDTNGNVYSTGYFIGTADFDPGLGNYDITSSASYHDAFVSKLDANGNFVWAKAFTGAEEIQAKAIDVDAVGNVYSTGFYNGTVDFDPGTGTAYLTTTLHESAYISKLDTNGDFVWVKHLNGDSNSYGKSIDVDGSGNIYTVGEFIGTVDFDPGAGIVNIVSEGYIDFFISKLDANGDYVWAKTIGAVGEITAEKASSIKVDPSGNAFISGIFSDTIDFDPSPNTFNLNGHGGSDAFILKLDNNGDFSWVQEKNTKSTLIASGVDFIVFFT